MDFDTAVAYVNVNKNFTSVISKEELVKIYALYKQSTVGDVNIPRPNIFNFNAVLKWNAWLDCKGLRKDVAKKEYIKLVCELKNELNLAAIV